MYRPGGKSTAILAGGRKKVHTTWDDSGFEQVEEFDLTTDQLLLRKVRQQVQAGREAKWEIEVGESSSGDRGAGGGKAGGELLISASQDQPYLVRMDTQDSFQWRVRNISFPVETYSVSADPATNQLVVRTANKKYFKRISVPDLDRHGLAVDEGAVSFTHCNRTLVISLRKPPFILQAEAAAKMERSALKCGKEGDVDCKQQ